MTSGRAGRPVQAAQGRSRNSGHSVAITMASAPSKTDPGSATTSSAGMRAWAFGPAAGSYARTSHPFSEQSGGKAHRR